MKPSTFSYSTGLIEIHIAVLLFGLAGLFAKWLSLAPWCIVLGRTGFAAIVLLAVLLVLREKPPKDTKTVCVFGLLGLLLAVHWIAFFKSIQVSTVAVGLLAFSTFPVFITFLEPWWFKEKRRNIDLVTAAMIVFGLGIMVYPSSFGGRIFSGALWGAFAGFSFAILSLLNRQWVQNCTPVTIAFYQNFFAFIFLLPIAVSSNVSIEVGEVGLLIVLGVFCTALSHFLFIRGLKAIRAQLASIIAGLEPVYGIFFAYLLLGEVPTGHTLIGGILIMAATLVATMFRKKNEGE
jgi:drug/metabolite transporter (DMT)-like permease